MCISMLSTQVYKANVIRTKERYRPAYSNSRGFNFQLWTDLPDRKSIEKKSDLICSIEQMDLIGIYRTFYPTTVEYTLFFSAHKSFSRTDHILDHKTSLKTLKERNNIILTAIE